MNSPFTMKAFIVFMLLGMTLVFYPHIASAHCDTLDGPVVVDARVALEKGDVTSLLKWIQPADEKEIHAAFDNTIKVRRLSAEAKELADMYFFETLVRVHRAGEGEPYTGLKAAGIEMEPGIVAADKSLASGDVAPVVKLLNDAVNTGVKERFEHTVELHKHANDSVADGRAFVAAYVEYLHYVERLAADATSNAVEHGAEEGGHAHH